MLDFWSLLYSKLTIVNGKVFIYLIYTKSMLKVEHSVKLDDSAYNILKGIKEKMESMGQSCTFSGAVRILIFEPAMEHFSAKEISNMLFGKDGVLHEKKA